VTDSRTGLIWERTAPNTTYTWSDAQLRCTSKAGAFRMPTIQELMTLTDPVLYNPASDADVFLGTATALYWSVTLYAGNGNSASPGAWAINMGDGTAVNPYYDNMYLTRCVR
jgi:hypothetical protein